MDETKPPVPPDDRPYPTAAREGSQPSLAAEAPATWGVPPPGVLAELVAWLERDAAVRTRLAVLLGVPAGLPEALNRLADESRAQRQTFEARFEAVDRRFEAVDRRFEAVDRRFEAVDRRFDEMVGELRAQREASEARFEAVDRRFDEMVGELRAQREASEARFEAIIAEQAALRRDFRVEIRRIGGRWGDRSEAAFRRGIIDLGTRYFTGTVEELVGVDDGTVFAGPPGRPVQLDVVVSDGETTLVEIKSRVRLADVDHLVRKAQWYQKRFARAPRLQFIAALIDKDAREYAAQLGITLSSSSPDLDEDEEP